jgi:biopolymer transport protein ExbD
MMEPVNELSAGQKSKIRRLSAPRELAPDEEGGELNVVPFLDIITNILIFVLATVAVTFTAAIDSSPPASGGKGVRKDIESTALNLTILIVNDGFSMKASGGNVALGCVGPGPGIAIPKKNGRYDYSSLNACAAKLKAASPDFAEESQFYVTGNPGTDYQTIVSVIDALRTDMRDPGRTLFTDVNFKVTL